MHEQAGDGNNTQAFVGHVLQWLFLWQIPPDAMRWVLDSVCKHPVSYTHLTLPTNREV